MQGYCKNEVCKRLIFDTEKLNELPDNIECQHCHTINQIRPKGETLSGPEREVLALQVNAFKEQLKGQAKDKN
jgi:NMD protein affecting ribosome stability and mRNA decay